MRSLDWTSMVTPDTIADARTREVAPTCPLSGAACAGRSCACAMRVGVGWICGFTRSRGKARVRVVDVDADALLRDKNLPTAVGYLKRGCLHV